MFHKMPRQDLIGDQFVPGNIKTFLQQYNIFYYPPEPSFPSSKVWIYLQGKKYNEKTNQNEPRYIKSLCFNNMESHKNFILNNILYHLYWKERIAESYIPNILEIGTFRVRILDSLLNEIRTKIIERWKKSIIEAKVY